MSKQNQKQKAENAARQLGWRDDNIPPIDWLRAEVEALRAQLRFIRKGVDLRKINDLLMIG